MMHELSQGAGFIRWFEDYPYGYYHADTTPLYIVAVRDYVRASGDAAFARDFWASMRKAYEYCASTDEDGDGLMDNTKAGLAAVETGTLRSRDVLTDVFLGTAWTEAAGAMADLARIAEPAFAATADAAAAKARASINRRFLDDGNRRINFAIMKDGTGQAEQTVWPAFGIWRGVFDPGHAAVAGMLDQLARSGLGTDWGARMLSNESRLYEPLSYNNGASWPFLTGWAALALYSGGRPAAAWSYLDALAALTFLEGRGYIPELLSGDRLRSVDAAVPHQLFATTGFVSTVMRGLVGLQERDGGLRLAPQLPAEWSGLTVKNLRWRGATGDLDVRRRPDGSIRYAFVETKGSLPVDLAPPLPPGAARLVRDAGGAGRAAAPATAVTTVGPIVRLIPEQEPLQLGDTPRRLRVIEERVDAGVYTARLQGLAGRTYRARLEVAADVSSIDGAREVGRDGSARSIEIAMPNGPGAWVEVRLSVRLVSKSR
jgi:hypothetical protein